MANIIVGMSGGVDSAVAALLLRDAGHRVTGLFMKNWDDDDGTEYCTAAQDLLDAEAVCHRLDIELETISFAADYRAKVFDHFLNEYRAGRTPNPDVLCNREIKFKVFIDHATALGADLVATGHYARLWRDHTGAALCKGIDPNKDQSYFLHAVPRDQLARAVFPLGGLLKHQVRAMAAQFGLHNHGRKDSTGICFIGERRFSEFLSRYLPAQPGPIISDTGVELGTHDGLMYYTLGQRQGMGIGGRRTSSGEPWFVIAKQIETRTLVVAQGAQHPALFSHALEASAPNWLTNIALPMHCTARTRYRQLDQCCEVNALASASAAQATASAAQATAGSRLLVTFTNPQRAITPGQSVVFYAGERCLGGAVIDASRVQSASTGSSTTPLRL